MIYHVFSLPHLVPRSCHSILSRIREHLPTIHFAGDMLGLLRPRPFLGQVGRFPRLPDFGPPRVLATVECAFASQC